MYWSNSTLDLYIVTQLGLEVKFILVGSHLLIKKIDLYLNNVK